jgi:hypothetical protein
LEITVLIEPVPGSGYRGRSGEPFVLTAEGATEEEVIERLCDAAEARLNNGAKVVTLDVPRKPHPWASFAGTLRDDDPLVQEWLEAMAERRRRMDEDPDSP